MKKLSSFIFTLVIVTGSFLLLVFFNELASCSAKYEDASNEEKHVHLIGNKYKTTKELLIYGITTDKNYKQQIDLYTIHEPPGIGGPEVLLEGHLEPGTVVQIKKVLRCINCIPPSLLELEIEILSEKKYRDHPVTVEKPEMRIEYQDGKAVINTELFQKVSE